MNVTYLNQTYGLAELELVWPEGRGCTKAGARKGTYKPFVGRDASSRSTTLSKLLVSSIENLFRVPVVLTVLLVLGSFSGPFDLSTGWGCFGEADAVLMGGETLPSPLVRDETREESAGE